MYVKDGAIPHARTIWISGLNFGVELIELYYYSCCWFVYIQFKYSVENLFLKAFVLMGGRTVTFWWSNRQWRHHVSNRSTVSCSVFFKEFYLGEQSLVKACPKLARDILYHVQTTYKATFIFQPVHFYRKKRLNLRFRISKLTSLQT
jgi:hypothetical protein